MWGKKNLVYQFGGLLVCFLFLQGNTLIVQGESIGNIGFTVEPIYPSNQISAPQGYFDLQVEPDQEQEVSVRIKSTQKTPVTIKAEVVNAFTNRYGEIDYGQQATKSSSNLTNMVTIEPNSSVVTVTNFEERIITFKLKTPIEPFSGISMGALVFTKDEEENSNSFAYRIGMMLNEDQESYFQKSELLLKDVRVGTDNGFQSIIIEIENPLAKMISGLEVNVVMTRADTGEVVESMNERDKAMAPNSIYQLTTPWDFSKVGIGEYNVVIYAEVDGAKWEWHEEISIKEVDMLAADEITTSAVGSNNQYIWWLLGIITIVCILAVVIMMKSEKVIRIFNKR